MKFWKTTILSSLLVLSLLGGLILHILQDSKGAKKNYQKIMAVSNSKTTLATDSSYTAKQLKEGTSKTILLSQEDTRKIGRLSCASSVLFFAKDDLTSELIEEMKNIHLLYQEELEIDANGFPFQTVLQLTADDAIYSYNQEKLTAKNVNIARYKLPNHLLGKDPSITMQPFFRGTADLISISFDSSKPLMQAVNLKARTL